MAESGEVVSAPESPAPRFPGYRPMVLRETIQAGDCFIDKHGNLSPSKIISLKIEEEDVGRYFRPLPEGPDPEKGRDGLEALTKLEALIRKHHFAFSKDADAEIANHIGAIRAALVEASREGV